MVEQSTVSETYDKIRAGIIDLLKAAGSAAARNVNSIMTAASWEIGRGCGFDKLLTIMQKELIVSKVALQIQSTGRV